MMTIDPPSSKQKLPLPNVYHPPIDTTYASDQKYMPAITPIVAESAYQNHLNKRFVNSKTSVILRGYMDSKQKMNKMLSQPTRTNKAQKTVPSSSKHNSDVLPEIFSSGSKQVNNNEYAPG